MYISLEAVAVHVIVLGWWECLTTVASGQDGLKCVFDLASYTMFVMACVTRYCMCM